MKRPAGLPLEGGPAGLIPSSRTRTIAGLMSGTSHDGIDAAIVRLLDTPPEKQRAELLHFSHTPFAPAMRRRIRAAIGGGAGELCRLNFELGRAFADAALSCMREAGIAHASLSAIASHGQTVWHDPPGPGHPGSTMQLGEPAVMARECGVPVVSNFRAADMALGGHGAPLVPLADYVLFRSAGETRAVHNLGGISNVTVVTPELDGVYAFDTGPANCLMDAGARLFFKRDMDRGGRLAARGRVHARMLGQLMRNAYLRKAPPKSTGPEAFGMALAGRMRKRFPGIAGEDFLATAVEFTARSIAKAYEKFILNEHALGRVYFSGGGTGNPVLMRAIAEALAPVKVSMTEELGVPGEAREAMAFAIIAAETLSGRPGNVPRATGASGPAVLGSITLP